MNENKPLISKATLKATDSAAYDKVYLEDVRSAVEGLSNAHLIGGDSICYVCKKHREGGVYDKQLVYCLQCWADKWFPVFTEKKDDLFDPTHRCSHNSGYCSDECYLKTGQTPPKREK